MDTFLKIYLKTFLTATTWNSSLTQATLTIFHQILRKNVAKMTGILRQAIVKASPMFSQRATFVSGPPKNRISMTVSRSAFFLIFDFWLITTFYNLYGQILPKFWIGVKVWGRSFPRNKMYWRTSTSSLFWSWAQVIHVILSHYYTSPLTLTQPCWLAAFFYISGESFSWYCYDGSCPHTGSLGSD